MKPSAGTGPHAKASPAQSTTPKAPAQALSQAKQPSGHTPSAAQPKADALLLPPDEEGALIDRWPGVEGAAEWNRREKEQEALGSLARLAGISAKDKGPAAKAGSQKAQQTALLQLQQQYRQQNFHEMVALDLNKEIRVDPVRSQAAVGWGKYPGSRTSSTAPKAAGGAELPHKRLKRSESAE